MGWSGPGADVSLSTIDNTRRYAVAGCRGWNAHCSILFVRVALICPTMVHLFPLSMGCSAGLRILDAL